MGKRSNPRPSTRTQKNIASGVAHVNASFNNTMITITDAQGNTICLGRRLAPWASRARARSTPYAAQVAAEDAAKKSAGSTAMPHPRGRGVAGARARDASRRCARCSRAGFTITSIRDVTPIPHNGCRPRKRRRV